MNPQLTVKEIHFVTNGDEGKALMSMKTRYPELDVVDGMRMIRQHRVWGNLFDYIDKEAADNPLHCDHIDYRKWEDEVAKPLLEKAGFSVVGFLTGEKDSFGILTRYAVCFERKTGRKIRLVYG